MFPMALRIGPINAATPTPLTSDGSFDREGAERLCRRWSDVGLDGVLLLGSMGEGLLLPDQVRTAFVECALEQAGDSLTVFVSAADRTMEAMLERALRYASMGAPCIVLSAPVGVSPREAVDQVRAVAELCPVPCAYYEVPPVTSVTLNLCEITEILSHPNICAFKDSSNNALLAQALTSSQFRRDGVKLLDGVEYRAAYSQSLGYDGVIHGGGVMTGRGVRCTWSAAQEGEIQRAIQLDRRNSLFLGRIYNRLSGPVQNIAGQKFALKLMGLFSHERAMVDQPLNGAAHDRIAGALAENQEWIA
jgi:dihydrodipicolinate synthase/N-acetylneuraminate lyase